jgi:Flp pilus assembly protein TadG
MQLALKRIRSDERGVAAVEFALIAPVMILLYCGLAELTIAMMAERRAAHSASVVADLVAQAPASVVSKADLDDIIAIGGSIMYPFPAAALKMRITSVVADNNAVPTMNWSRDGGLGKMPAGAVTGFPPNLLAKNDSVIQADIRYTFTSPLKYIMPNSVTFNDTYYLKPRTGTPVTCSNCP